MSQVNILYWGGMLSIVLAMHGRATADSAKYPVKFINLIDDSLKISALESDDNLSDTLDDEATIHPGKAIAFYVQGERKKDTSKRSYKMSVCNSGVCKAVYTMTFELESRWNGSGRIRIEGDSKQYAVRKRPKGQSEYKFNLVIIDYKNDTNSNDPRTVKNPIELINLTDETFTISKCSSDKDVSDDLSSSKKIPRGKAFDFTVFGKHRWFSTIGATYELSACRNKRCRKVAQLDARFQPIIHTTTSITISGVLPGYEVRQYFYSYSDEPNIVVIDYAVPPTPAKPS